MTVAGAFGKERLPAYAPTVGSSVHLEQVQRGIDYIEDHLDEDIDAAEVARRAGLSRWHFQRVFRALTNETLKTYIRSRRLSLACEQLLHTRRRILEIALAAGYESQESFTRAFKLAFEMTPNEYRKIGHKRLFLEKVRFDAAYLQHLAQRRVTPEPQLYLQPQITMVGLRTTFYGSDSERNNLGQKLPALWDAFMQRLSEVENRVTGVCYGVVQPTAPDSELLDYHAAVEIRTDCHAHSAAHGARLPDGMVQLVVPEASYAKFTHRGLALEVDHTVNYAYSTWLLSSGKRHTLGPDLEIYGHQFHPTSPASSFDYAIPVR